MIEIDYDLIPLSPERERQISKDARSMAVRGKVPPITAADFGRLVVVNPNQGFTIHHVPDDLRKPLRRQLVQVYDGVKPVPADTIVAQILERQEEVLRAVLLELHSNFPQAADLVAKLPEVRRLHPDCRFLIHGDLSRTATLLQGLMAKPGAACRLRFHAFDGEIALQGADALANVFIDLPKYPTLPAPFFESLRVHVGNRADSFNLAAMKRLYPLFGVGNIGELDVSGKLKDRLITVDLPLTAIASVRFRGDRVDGFHAIRLDGDKIPSAQFVEAGLTGKDVPMSKIESVFRRMPGREEEEIELSRIRALRVNCFEGHVSFLWKPTPDFIPLYETTELHWHPRGAAPAGNGGGAGFAEDDGLGVNFEHVVVTEPGRPRFGDVRAGVRELFLERVYAVHLAKQVKLKEYASQLKIACLGPISAQIFKLLKPMGLSKFLPANRPFYLCDRVDQVPDYRAFHERLDKDYQELVASLRTLFAHGADAIFDPDHINHRMPIVIEWSRGKAPPLAKVEPEHLNSVYNELRVFLKFAEIEFRRVLEPDHEPGMYFSKLELCRQAGLSAKRLASVKSGSYGKLFGPGESPDFVFFANEKDVGENRARFFLPGLAWPEVFRTAGAGPLSWDVEYGFTVFLDEQLAIIDSMWRQDNDGAPPPQYFDDYFQSRIQEVERELKMLEHLSDPNNAIGTPGYAEAAKRIETDHKAEIAEFERELRGETAVLHKAEEIYFRALGHFSADMGRDFTPELLIASDDYITALDGLIAKRSNDILVRLRDTITRVLQSVNKDLDEARVDLKAFLESYPRVPRAFLPLAQAQFRRDTLSRAHAGVSGMLGRLNELQRGSEAHSEKASENLHARRVTQKEEAQREEAELSQLVALLKKDSERLRERMNAIFATFTPRQESDKASQLGLIRAIEEAVTKANPELAEALGSARTSQQRVIDTIGVLLRRRMENTLGLYLSANEMALLENRGERGMLGRFLVKTISEPLVPLQLPPAPGAEKELQAEFDNARAEWERSAQKLAHLTQVERHLQEVRAPIAEYQQLQKVFQSFKQAVDAKARHQRSAESIRKHLEKLRLEAQNLPRLIQERLLPAFRLICERHLMPRAEDRMSDFRHAQSFARESAKLSFESVQRDFLDHAVFRRFQGIQFRAGAFYGIEPSHPLSAQLGNIAPALYHFHRHARTNLRRLGFQDGDITLTKLPLASSQEIRQLLDEQRTLSQSRRYTYLVLPGTLDLKEALGLIGYKESLFRGLPQLVLIYISRFDPNLLLNNATIREGYFHAGKHNIILNIAAMVDNPGSISVRLTQETIGRAFDLARVDLMPDTEVTLKSTPA